MRTRHKMQFICRLIEPKQLDGEEFCYPGALMAVPQIHIPVADNKHTFVRQCLDTTANERILGSPRKVVENIADHNSIKYRTQRIGGDIAMIKLQPLCARVSVLSSFNFVFVVVNACYYAVLTQKLKHIAQIAVAATEVDYPTCTRKQLIEHLVVILKARLDPRVPFQHGSF